MKHLVFIALFASAVTTRALAGEKKADNQPARPSAAIAKAPPRAPGPPRQFSLPQQVERGAPILSGQPSFRSGSGRVLDSEFRGDARRKHPLTPRFPNVEQTPRFVAPGAGPVVAPPLVPQPEIAASNPRDRDEGQKWRRDRGNWTGNNNESGNWSNKRNGGLNNQTWQNRHGNPSDFSNRSEEWRRRHGHWDRCRHDRSWWRSNYTRFVLFGGGYYYWNSGYWYPAYGYDPYFRNYSYDAPIYGYNDLDPGQVIANVQAELERRGYYVGGIDGSYGPMTRRALLNYQSDNGLPVTGEIDEETLDSLGLE